VWGRSLEWHSTSYNKISAGANASVVAGCISGAALRNGITSWMLSKAALDLLSEISEQEPIELLREGWRQIMGAIANDDPNAALMLLNDQGHSSPASALPSGLSTCPKFIAKYTLAQNKPKQNSQPKHRKATNVKP